MRFKFEVRRAGMRVLGALLGCAFAGGVHAQRIDSPYRFLDTNQLAGGWAGYIGASEGSIGLGPEAAPVFGGRYGIRVSGPFALEVEAGWFNSTRAVLDTVPADTTFRTVGSSDVSLVVLRGGVRFNITGPRTYHGVQPFLMFGGGVAIDIAGTTAEDEALPANVRFDFGTSFAGDVGAGIEWFVSRNLALRLDGRNLLWRLETPEAFLLGPRGENLPDKQWAQNFFVSVGLSLHF
jgi:hypothetical protein